jgi:hypothetical protein
MSVEAYILTTQSAIIPALLPDEAMREVARQLGIPEQDLFSVDIPCGMSRHTRATMLIASTQMNNFGSDPVSLVLKDSSGLTITLSNLYVRPPQPFWWTEQGGVALVELVDRRWWWRFSTSGIRDKLMTVAFSSDGRWQANTINTTSPAAIPKITTFGELWQVITTEATALGLTMPSTPTFSFSTPEKEQAMLRRLSDFLGSQTVSMAMLIDAIGIIIGSVMTSTVSGYAYTSISGLKAAYDNTMNSYRTALRGGMQPTTGANLNTDVLVGQWQTYGFNAKSPRNASVVMPFHAVEGRTYYDNCSLPNVPTGGMHFCANALYTAPANAALDRNTIDIGVAWLPEASVVSRSDVGQPLNPQVACSPGWELNDSDIIQQYANRCNGVPFGRTMWAGWIPRASIGQIGMVSYRVAMLQGEMSPYTISVADQEDWIFSASGMAITDPERIIVGKGLAQAYRNLIGATIIDVAPPNCRIFPARILDSEQYDGEWRWRYSFEEVEPNPDILSTTLYVPVNAYGRRTQEDLIARNLAEAGNEFYGAGNTNNVIAPGVTQIDISTGSIAALPISSGTIVMMCEQFPTIACAYQGEEEEVEPPFPPQYWFSMPNAVQVICDPQFVEEGGGEFGEPEPL